MAQASSYFQDNFGGQPTPMPPVQYSGSTYDHQARRASHDATAAMHYSNLGDYGPSNMEHLHNLQSIPISHRSRTSLGRTNPSAYPADYPKSPSHPLQSWDSQHHHHQQQQQHQHQHQSSYGFGQVPAPPVYPNQPQWQSAQLSQGFQQHRNSIHNPGSHYMGVVGVPNEEPSHITTATGSAVMPLTHASQHWAGPSDPRSLSLYTMRSDDSPLQLSPDLPLSSYSFSSVPSPSSSPSPSRIVDLSPVLGHRRASIDATPNVKRCSHCNATSTPLWRRNPMTMQPLCNACGLYLQQRNKLRPQELIDASNDDDETEDESDRDPSAPRCSHCQTHVTSVWRRSKTGEQLCNACGVYLRLRGKPRPLSLKQKKIKPRPHSSKHASK